MPHFDQNRVVTFDRSQASEQLKALGYKQKTDLIFIRYIDPTRQKPADMKEGARSLNQQEIEAKQRQGYDVYFVVNGQGNTDNKIKVGRALWFEHDNMSKELQRELWKTLRLPEPTLQVDTGGKSIHSYWVFDEPIPIEQWKKLQSDLLEYSDADRTIKNPARILRLAGCAYMKGDNPGTTQATIISNSGKRYTYDKLRVSIPQPQIKTPLPQKNYQPSIPDEVPLYQCLTKDDRALLDSGATNNRNSQGAKLARNLIGTAARLNHLGYRFNGDPYQEFIGYCQRCRQGDGWNQKEWDAIWKSALKDNPTPTLKDDALANCVKAWHLQQQRQQPLQQHQQQFSSPKAPPQVATLDNELTREQAIASARATLMDFRDELTCNLKLEDIRIAAGISNFFWENKILKPLKKDINSQRFKLDLANLLLEEDKVERIRQQALLAPIYQMSASAISQALAEMKARQTTPETKVYSFSDLLALESEGLQWLIPELLPKGETIIIGGSPKTGKTLLSIDAAFALVTGESDFLGLKTRSGLKVLIVSTDESLQSTKSKLLKRGFRRQDSDRLHIIPQWNIAQLGLLEEQLEDFRPDLVIVDSLRRINHGSSISENSAEFADNIYTLKELFAKYGASGILIHHTNKDKEAMGVEKLRGSSAIAGAVWGTWQLEQILKPDPNNKKKLIVDPRDPHRTLTIFARDTEGQRFNIKFDPENNSWNYLATPLDTEALTIRERILKILTQNRHMSGLSGREIIELLGMTTEEGRGVYTELNRMVNKLLISCRPAPGDKRYNIYSLPDIPPPPPRGGGNKPTSPPDDEPPPNQPISPNSDELSYVNTELNSYIPPLPPSPTVQNVEDNAESINGQGLEPTQLITQQPIKNTQKLEDCRNLPNNSNESGVSNVAILNNIQTTGGGGGMTSAADPEEEALVTLGIAADCDDPALLDEIREIYPANILRQISKKLTPGQHAKIMSWVVAPKKSDFNFKVGDRVKVQGGDNLLAQGRTGTIYAVAGDICSIISQGDSWDIHADHLQLLD